MLNYIILFFTLMISQAYCLELGNFHRTVSTKNLLAECEYNKKRGDETGIFFIDFKDNDLTHTFLILRGIEPSTCRRLEREAKQLIKTHASLILIGANGNEYPQEKSVTWFWQSLRSNKDCVSYFEHECPKSRY